MCLVVCLRVYLCVGELQYDQYSALLFYRPARYTRCVNTNKWLAAFCESVCVCVACGAPFSTFSYISTDCL